MMVPEHGAAIRGDKMQISGLREIPSPQITHGVVGIRLLGQGVDTPAEPIVITKPTSFIEISTIVANILSANPFDPGSYNPADLVKNVQQTASVSENGGTVVLEHNGKYFIRLDGSNNWTEYQ